MCHYPPAGKQPPSRVTYSVLIVLIFTGRSSEENKLIKCPERISFLHVPSSQVCHVWTHAVSEVGYVGALQQPILHRGLKDQKSN